MGARHFTGTWVCQDCGFTTSAEVRFNATAEIEDPMDYATRMFNDLYESEFRSDYVRSHDPNHQVRLTVDTDPAYDV